RSSTPSPTSDCPWTPRPPASWASGCARSPEPPIASSPTGPALCENGSVCRISCGPRGQEPLRDQLAPLDISDEGSADGGAAAHDGQASADLQDHQLELAGIFHAVDPKPAQQFMRRQVPATMRTEPREALVTHH